MAIVKCPDCGKMISDLAPACIGCGRPMTPVSGLSPAPPPSPAPSEAPRRTSVPTPLSQEEEYSGVPEGTTRSPSDLPKKKIIAHKIFPPPPEAKKRFTATKTFTMAFLLTGILSVVAGAFALSQGRHVSKNPIWTFAWMYLSVEAWRSWGWKALLPYPISVAATVLIGGLLFVSGVELMSWPYIIVIGVCNLGGLILFNLLLQKSKAAFSERDFRNRNEETSQDTRAPFWPVALVALIIGGIFYGVYVSNRPAVHNPNAGRTNETSRQFQPAPSAASNVDQQQDPGASASGKVDWNKELTAAGSAPTQVAVPESAPPEQENAQSLTRRGLLHYNGEGVHQDYAEAARLFFLAAGKGYADAQYCLGLMYFNGFSLPQDFAEAVRLFRLAADQGTAQAQNALGVMYRDGTGVPQDTTMAVKWFRMAAAQGHKEAQNALMQTDLSNNRKVDRPVGYGCKSGIIDLSFKNTDIREVFDYISKSACVNIVYHQNVYGVTSVYMKDVRWDEAVQGVISTQSPRLKISREADNMIYVSTY